MATLDDLYHLIGKPRRTTRFGGCPALTGCCPAHDDATPSFYAWEGEEGWLHVRCARCSEAQILSALGWQLQDLKVDNNPNPTPTRLPNSEYVYRSAEGQNLLRKTRYYKRNAAGELKKTFFLETFKDGEWRTGTSHVPQVGDLIYRLPEVLKHKLDRPIYVVNGEKAADRMMALKALATCQPYGEGGSVQEAKGKWKPAHTAHLRGALHVIVVADLDPVGEEYARFVASQLKPHVTRLEVVQSRTANPKDDAYDHLEAGFGLTDFIPRPDLMPGFEKAHPFTVLPLESYEIEEPLFLWEPYLRMDQINLLDAKGGSGKTTLSIAIAVQGSLGIIPWQGECEPFRTLYFGHEDSPGEIRKLYQQLGGKEGFFYPMVEPFQLNDANIRRVRDTICDLQATYVVFDAITYYVGELIKNPFNGMEIAPYLGKLRDVARYSHCAIQNIRHFKQGTAGLDSADMGSGSEQWRNSHRSQLVLRPHPDAARHPRFGIVEHKKGSLNSPRGQPFGYQFIEGVFRWAPPSEIDLSVFDKPPDPPVQQAMEASEAVDWVKAFLRDGAKPSREVFAGIEAKGGTRDLAYEAKRVLGVLAKSIGVKGRKGSAGWTWELPDPFA